MAEPPNLTDSQAALLRFAYYASGSIYDIADADPDNPEPVLFAWKDYGGRVEATPLGRAALAAYDAEQRRAIRVEAMLDCANAAMAVHSQSEADGEEDDDVFDLAQERAYGAKLVLRAIADLLAKEESNG